MPGPPLTSPASAGLPAAADRERALADIHVGERVRAHDSIADLQRFILERTQGNPFFMEEMVQALFEEGVLVRNGAIHVARPLAQLHLPPGVQGILAARIDRLPAREKELLQALAVIGREFPHSLVGSVTQTSPEELERMLGDLQLGEFIYEQPAFPEVEYTFKHALTQEVAYNSLLLGRRKLLHERTGAAIESLYAARLEDHLDELAHHYRRSDNAAKAIEYLGRAAAQALSRSHYGEAYDHSTAALDLLVKLPDGPDRLQAELGLQMLTAQAASHAIGFNAAEVERALSRAESICREIGNPAQMFPILSALRIYYLGFGNHRRVRELAAQMVEIAEKQGSKDLLAEAYFHWGDSLWFGAQFREALTYLERAIAHCQPGQRVAADIDALTMSLSRLAPTLWSLGYADQALDACRRALEGAAGLKHPASLTVAQFTFCVVRRLRRDREAEHEAETLAAFAKEHGLSYYDGVAFAFRSLALLEQGLVTQALRDLLQIVELSRQTGIKLMLPAHLAAIGEAYGRMRERSRGLEVISEAFTEIEDGAQQQVEPELHRIKGDLLLMQDASNAEQAEQSFRKAIEIARRQEARFYELRATMSLARLLDRQGHRDEARAMLCELYNWFTEGFDTTDLKEAKALLDQLAP